MTSNNMNASNLDSLLKQKNEIEKKIETVYAESRREELKNIISKIKYFEISPQECFGKKILVQTKKAAAQSFPKTNKVNAKYRNPATNETWTGRGKAPLWIKDKDRKLFEIKN